MFNSMEAKAPVMLKRRGENQGLPQQQVQRNCVLQSLSPELEQNVNFTLFIKQGGWGWEVSVVREWNFMNMGINWKQ